jgi:hypothetical protein
MVQSHQEILEGSSIFPYFKPAMWFFTNYMGSEATSSHESTLTGSGFYMTSCFITKNNVEPVSICFQSDVLF